MATLYRRFRSAAFALLVAATVLGIEGPRTLLAQDAGTAAPSLHVRAIDGEALLDRDGQSDPLPLGMPIVEGDMLSTRGGRIELQTAGGSVIDLDEYSTLEIAGDRIFRLREGRLGLIVSPDDPTARGGYDLETPDGLVTATGSGTYQVAAGGRAGDSATRFARWIDERRRERASAHVSRRYLPGELSPYADTFDRYGTWQMEPGYGYVWSPRVEIAWQPFYAGYWSLVGRYGWTWISGDRWGWPTHHYGRWHYLRSRWFWSAGRGWSPAWVTWRTSASYVSWSPIGARPSLSAGYIGGPFGASLGWVVVPHDYFHRRRSLVARYAVPIHRLDRRTTFVEHTRPPMAAASRRADVAGNRASRTRERQYSAGAFDAPSYRTNRALRADRAIDPPSYTTNGSVNRVPRVGGQRGTDLGDPRAPGRAAVRRFDRPAAPPSPGRDLGGPVRQWTDRPSTGAEPAAGLSETPQDGERRSFRGRQAPAPAFRPEPPIGVGGRAARGRLDAALPDPSPLVPVPASQSRPDRGASSERSPYVPMRQPPSYERGGGRRDDGPGARPQNGHGGSGSQGAYAPRGSQSAQGSQGSHTSGGSGGHAVRRSGR